MVKGFPGVPGGGSPCTTLDVRVQAGLFCFIYLLIFPHGKLGLIWTPCVLEAGLLGFSRHSSISSLLAVHPAEGGQMAEEAAISPDMIPEWREGVGRDKRCGIVGRKMSWAPAWPKTIFHGVSQRLV